MWKRVLAGATATLTLGAGTTAVLDNRVDPYTDKGTHYELPIQSDIPQGERVEIAKDRAAMTLRAWNDEVAITVTPQIPTTQLGAVDRPFVSQGNRPLLSKKMEYRSGDVTAFIEPRDNANEFDIDFTLHAKPDTNVFTYKIAGADEFDFFYQPELTPEEIAEGAERPDNVIGSYAVYHKTKANHRIGSTNYATGKAFHIYRPKAIDAKGNEVWADLSYGSGILTVTVPQAFLDTAIYPVRVDPTFGYTSIGASLHSSCTPNVPTQTRTGNSNSLGENGTLDSISAALKMALSSTSLTSTFFINRTDDPSANNHSLVVKLEATLSVTTTATWYTQSAASESLSSDDYIISFLCNSSGLGTSNNGQMSFDTSSLLRYRESNSNYATLRDEDPWTVTGASNTQLYSIYATYTASGGAAPANNTYFEVLN